MNEVEMQSAANDDGDGSSDTDDPSRSERTSRSDGLSRNDDQLTAGSLVTNQYPSGAGRKV